MCTEYNHEFYGITNKEFAEFLQMFSMFDLVFRTKVRSERRTSLRYVFAKQWNDLMIICKDIKHLIRWGVLKTTHFPESIDTVNIMEVTESIPTFNSVWEKWREQLVTGKRMIAALHFFEPYKINYLTCSHVLNIFLEYTFKN